MTGIEMKQLVAKIISGGQTGADKGGLLTGRQLEIPTGGTAPKGWRTERGSDHTLESYGLSQSTLADYGVRTRRNVENSDMTLIISSDHKSPGTKQTVDACHKLNKPFILINPDSDIDQLVKVVSDKIRAVFESRNNNPICINVAGNRESKSPGIEQKTVLILTKILNDE